MRKDLKLRIIYFIFVGITILALIPPILYLSGYSTIWKIYTYLYVGAIGIYIWWRFIHLAYYDFKKQIWEANLYTPFTVVVPVYNEEPQLLEKTIESVQNAKGDKKVIIIDDGSTNGIWETIQKFHKKYDNVKLIKFNSNKGKRYALYHAFQRTETEFVITIDSDTIIEKNSFVRLIAPFVEKNIGATTGNIYLLNEKRNFLTRVIAGMCLSGLNNYKKAQSVRGNVICCSGCLSAYRTELVKKMVKHLTEQEFFGKRVTHSEDRHLTNLILENGYKVVYVERSVCYTESPHTLVKFLKQQQRWKRGFVRETIYLLSHSQKTSKSLFFEALIGNALPYFLSFGIQIYIISLVFVEPLHVLIYLIPGWVIFVTIRESPMITEKPITFLWYYFYILLYEIFLWWQNLLAIFTVNNKGWLTR